LVNVRFVRELCSLMSENPVPRPKFSISSLKEALRIFRFILPYRWQFIIGLVLLFISSGVFMIFPFGIGLMLDVAQGKVRPDFDLGLIEMGLVIIVILLVQGVISYIRVMLFAQISEKGTADIRQALYSKIISLPIVFFEQNRTGELNSRLTNDIGRIYNTFSFILAEFVRQLIFLAGGALFLLWQTPKLAGIMMLTIPILVVAAIIFGRWIRNMSKNRQKVLGDSNTILDETLQTIHAVKAFSNELFENNRYRQSNENVVQVSMKFAASRAIFTVFVITLLFGALFFVIWMGMRMIQSGEVSAGQLVSFVTFTAVVGASIAALSNFFTELVGAVGASERLLEILDTPSEIEERPQTNLKAGRLKGDISLENIGFAYPTRPDMPVLKGVDLTISSGSKVALVGQSGAGKSTIMQLLLQFHRPDSGRVLADGRDIQDYELSSYRENFALVPQEVILFGGSIRENIIYGKPDATGQEIEIAARQANAWEFISRFPEGLETVVGERGLKLSGGQRQRIAIARAILRNPSVLLLDEATSSLDAESERLVQEALENLMKGRTSIIIAHRLATIREVDCIYVLEGGKIVEQGTHAELSAKADGVYSSLARLQFNLMPG
jgi:ATP-binding cassette subfamily B protein